MSEILFQKILNNTASEAEKVDFFRTIENDPEKREEYLHYKNLAVLSNLNPEQYAKKKNENFSRFWNEVQPRRIQKMQTFWMRYAAIFILASVFGYFANYILNQNNPQATEQHLVYSSEKGSISIIHLEDGSAIWLSSGTRLILDKNKEGEMTANLNGEAYFDLIPNPDRKFMVDLGHFKVKDIGTSFNIRAYKDETQISTSLVEGKIEMINNSDKSFLSVMPGEFVSYDKTNNKISVTRQDPSITTAWKEGKFVFIDKSLTEICRELENWYNIEIQIEDQKLANTRYTSVVKRSTTVQMVLKILAVTDQINYEITEKKEGKDIIKIRK